MALEMAENRRTKNNSLLSVRKETKERDREKRLMKSRRKEFVNKQSRRKKSSAHKFLQSTAK